MGSAGANEPVLHNSVLIRTREPSRGARWVMPAFVAAVLVVGAGAFAFLATHPTPPIVNHAVAAAPATPSGGAG
jgi:hypothetical protein